MHRLILTTSILFLQIFASAQPIARFTADISRYNLPSLVSINLDNITTLSESELILTRQNDMQIQNVSFQVENGNHRFLWFVARADKGNIKQVFELRRKNATAADTVANHALIDTEKENVTLTIDHKKLLQYNFGIHYPPPGVDSAYKRSGFIHPLWSSQGNILTQINPTDHYHHMGIWNPWTHVLFRGHEIDFWNLKDRKGTVRFSKLIETSSGQIYSSFKALQEHVAFNLPDSGQEMVVMNEIWDIRAFPLNEKMWICDFTSYLDGATDSLVTLKEYRYGGFGFRATAEWDSSNSRVLTSEGKTRKDADASTARWCIVEGAIKDGRSGIVFMSHPSNYNFPEPMRVWPEDANKRGDVFFSFSPTRNKDWVLTPGKTHVLKYRMLVYDGKITKEQAEEAWKNFGDNAAIKVELIKKKQ